MIRLFAATLLALGCSAAMSGCATMSEAACVAGDWEGQGFKDGTNGHSRARLADISKTCGKYSARPDRVSYLRGLEDGLVRHCTPDRGFRRDREGGGINNERSVRGFDGYLLAHADGYAEYRVESEYRGLTQRWEETDTARLNVAQRLLADDLPDAERLRLRKKLRRLERRADSLRIDIRAMEPTHRFPRWTPV